MSFGQEMERNHNKSRECHLGKKEMDRNHNKSHECRLGKGWWAFGMKIPAMLATFEI